MTREEIFELKAGPELDRLVAEHITGWKEGEKGPRVAKWGVGILGEKVLPRYSTDIAAAWSVVEKLVNLGWLVNLLSPWKGNATYHWTCYVERQGKSGWEKLEVAGDSAPAAICRAALLAMIKANNE